MSIGLVRVFWQSHPYGWRLRWLGEEGQYTGELLCSAPPFHDLCSGSLNPDDANDAWRLVKTILASVTTEPALATPMSYVGYVVPVGPNDQSSPAYYYYPQDDKRLSTRNYVQLVLILDKYMKAHYQSLIDKDDSWS